MHGNGHTLFIGCVHMSNWNHRLSI